MKRHQDVKLQSVYVEPRFSSSGGKSDPRGAAAGPPKSVLTAEHVPSSKTLKAQDLVSLADNIVILGDAGAGKSTLTKFLISSLIEGRLAIPDRAVKSLPIRVPLRAYSEFRSRPDNLGSTIIDFVRANTKTELQHDDLPDEFFEVFLGQRAAVVIFDGLDEIFDAHLREQVRNDITSFALGSYPGNKIIVMSRKIGYEEVSFQQPEFVHFEILPFETEQISEYIRKWYALEESDRSKRVKEIAEITSALQKLPGELLGNPLLLSLIVILFRSGCTLPDSKLEIYRSCVGTLTEKWDAAGKRLELPPEYSLVRDKKSAFAHIGYWMYRRQTGEVENLSRPKYNDVLIEFTRYLREREFQDREEEAEQAAKSFLEYAAKRSIFIEDRFTHKTFHEYFAALYLFKHFCVGRTVDDLYAEIKPFLSNDSWSVVLELLLLMIDEQGSVLLEALLDKMVREVRMTGERSYADIIPPLRILGQLQNIGMRVLNSLFELTAEGLLLARLEDSWEKKAIPESIHQKIFTAVESIPPRFLSTLAASLKRVATASRSTDVFPLLAAYTFESRLGLPGPEEVIPDWERVSESLACRHLSVFYALAIRWPVSKRMDLFLKTFGSNNLFRECGKIFQAGTSYRPFAEYTLLSVDIPVTVEALDTSCQDFLSMQMLEPVLPYLVKRSLTPGAGYNGEPDNVVEHFSKAWKDPRKYLVDYLIMARCWLVIRAKPPRAKKFRNSLRVIARKSSGARLFYARLLLGTAPLKISHKKLGVSPSVFHELLEISKQVQAARQQTSGAPSAR